MASEIRATHLSRRELQERKAILLGILDVFLTCTQSGIEQELAEVRYLLGEEAAETP